MDSDGFLPAERYSPSELVVRAVAEAEGVPTEEVTPPLHEAVDPEALDDLFDDGRPGGRVSFSYADYGVTVHGDGNVDVRVEE